MKRRECYTKKMNTFIYTKIIVAIMILSGVMYGLFLTLNTENQKPEPDRVLVNEESDKKGELDGVVRPEAINQNPVSFEALFDIVPTSGTISQGEILDDTSTYTKYTVTYPSADYTISGVLYVPKGTPPKEGFPVLITNHGYIDPAVYTNGRGLKREQEYFAKAGYVVLHPDYRNHAGSTKTNDNSVKVRLGYVEDVINAVTALRNSKWQIERDNISMLGHSMGGGVSLSVALAKPDLVKKVILYAPVTIDARDSFERYLKDDTKRRKAIVALYGTPESNPDFWKGVNGEEYMNRLQIPIRIYHGTSDADVPLKWTDKTVAALRAAGKDAEVIIYPGEQHEFGPRFQDFMKTSREFLES
jgi:uncharacterized protein